MSQFFKHHSSVHVLTIYLPTLSFPKSHLTPIPRPNASIPVFSSAKRRDPVAHFTPLGADYMANSTRAKTPARLFGHIPLMRGLQLHDESSGRAEISSPAKRVEKTQVIATKFSAWARVCALIVFSLYDVFLQIFSLMQF